MAEAGCPECGKPHVLRFAPFCSVRCQQIDLGRWLKGDFVIPGKPDEDRAGAGGPAAGTDPDEE
jgi:endogenous inhibitor of DNA gyrase (YacG/DUF329 family)